MDIYTLSICMTCHSQICSFFGIVMNEKVVQNMLNEFVELHSDDLSSCIINIWSPQILGDLLDRTDIINAPIFTTTYGMPLLPGRH
jgi:hypothetical protein